MPTRAVPTALLMLLAFSATPPASAEEEPAPDEVIVNVLPGRGAKFDPAAIYQEDQAVLQGVFGTAGPDAVADLLLLPDKRILVAGVAGSPKDFPAAPRGTIEGLATGGTGYLAEFDPTFRMLERVTFLPPEAITVGAAGFGPDGSLYLAGRTDKPYECYVWKLDPTRQKLVWRTTFPGDAATSLVVLADGSVVVYAGGPFIVRVAADGGGLVPWGGNEKFRIDRANPDIEAKYWVGLGYKAAGFRDQSFLRGGVSRLGLLPDGNLAILACHSIRIPNGAPDFDAMLVIFSTAGEVLVTKNLAEGIPNEPDNKYPRLHVDRYTGDLILSLTQHGHFQKGHNLAVTPGCYLTTDEWYTEDIFIGWIGRVDSRTGEIKHATMYFPDARKPKFAGKSTANSLFPEALATDPEGRIYVAGAAAYRLETTLMAFQTEPLDGSGFLTVFDSQLSEVLYANLITARGFALRPAHLLLTPLGPLVASTVTPLEGKPGELVTANTEKTNFLRPDAPGTEDVMFTLLPSKTWFLSGPR